MVNENCAKQTWSIEFRLGITIEKLPERKGYSLCELDDFSR